MKSVTNKQMWRRAMRAQRSKSIDENSDSGCTLTNSLDDLSGLFDECDSVLTKSTSKKRLSFDKMMRVVLIPSIGEYKEAGIFNQVWHDEEELRTMKQEAIAEVKVYMSLTGEQHPGRAIRSLYK